MRRLLGALLGLVVLSACAPPPRPFEHDSSATTNRRLPSDKIELAIGAPRNMPPEMGQRVAAALAMELQAYGIVATVQPADAPIQVSGTMSTRDSGETGIEIQIDWRIEGAPKTQDPQTSRTKARPEDYGEASERLVSRIAQQAAPRVATLIGKPPNFLARSLGQVAAGVSVPMEQPVDPVTATAMAAASSGAPPPSSTQPAQPQEAHVKVMVAPVTGAPSDGNRQLYSGMRRALGSSKIVIVDAAGADVFTVIGNVNLTQIDEQAGPARHQMAGQGPGRPQCRRPRTVQSGAARRHQGKLGRIRRHCRNGGLRRRARTARKGVQPAPLVNPSVSFAEAESSCQRGVRDCYCPGQRLDSCREDRTIGSRLLMFDFRKSVATFAAVASVAGLLGAAPASAQTLNVVMHSDRQDSRSDLDHRLHRAQSRLPRLGHAVRHGREVRGQAADGRQVRRLGRQAHLDLHPARRPRMA